MKLPKTESKFSNVSLKTVLVEHTGTGYILCHPDSRKFLEPIHVRFLEKLTYKYVYKKTQNENEERKQKGNTSEILIEFLEKESSEEFQKL